jgi:glycosyltransferase involved in cell wall biosynthesis
MLRHEKLCVVHVAAAGDRLALETLCHTTQVIAPQSVAQVLVLLEQGGANLIWSAALAAEVRLLRCSGLSIAAKIGALQLEFSKLSRERKLYAVHLHGVGPCLLGSQALKGAALQGRVLYSPHLTHAASPWTAALLRPLVQSYLDSFDCAAVTTSPAEAQTLSKLLNRSAEVLPPHTVSGIFFDAARQDGTRPSVLANGSGVEAVDVVSRLSVLLNSRGARIPFSWLGMAEARLQAQLEAAGVKVLDIQDHAEKAQLLSRTSAFVHIASDSRLLIAIAQAMAAGVPCLVSDTTLHRALVRHGETGFICTSERDFLEKLILLLRDRAERQRVGEAARAEAERWFTSKHFERAILRAYGLSRVDAGLSRVEAGLSGVEATERRACEQPEV